MNMINFWKKLKYPTYALAPMSGITDSAFRQICKSFGADVVYSELASATALVYNPARTLELVKFTREEKPYIIQLFGSRPEHFAVAARLISGDKKTVDAFSDKFRICHSLLRIPDGIDINFGCPAKKVLKQGAGAALMDNLKLARDVVKAVCGNTCLPVSIKTRTKGRKHDCLELLNALRGLPLAGAMIHGRTLAQGFAGGVDTEIIKKARDYFGGVILANGGTGMSAAPSHSTVNISWGRGTVEYVQWLLSETGADGIGIGRGAMGRPWIFEEAKSKKIISKSYDEIVIIILKHAKLLEKSKGERGIAELRGHLCHYVAGLHGARHLREELVKVKNVNEIKEILIR